MKVTINASGYIPLARSFNMDANGLPSVGDTVIVDGTSLEVYERVFNCSKLGEVDLLCREKSPLS